MVLVGCRFRMIAMLLLILMAAPCHAWLYDAGIPQHAGTAIGENADSQWVAAPFEVEEDAYATTFGAAIGRAMGPAGSGFDVYLTETLAGLPSSSIVKLPQPLVPLNTQYVYYYGTLDKPVLLHAGTAYALVLMPTSPDLIGMISYGVKSGTYYGWKTSDHGKLWSVLSYPLCVRVDGYAVPEPASIAVLIPAICLVSLLRKRAR